MSDFAPVFHMKFLKTENSLAKRLVLAALFVAATTVALADWPQFRGPLGTGHIPDGQALPAEVRACADAVPDAVVYSISAGTWCPGCAQNMRRRRKHGCERMDKIGVKCVPLRNKTSSAARKATAKAKPTGSTVVQLTRAHLRQRMRSRASNDSTHAHNTQATPRRQLVKETGAGACNLAGGTLRSSRQAGPNE